MHAHSSKYDGLAVLRVGMVFCEYANSLHGTRLRLGWYMAAAFDCSSWDMRSRGCDTQLVVLLRAYVKFCEDCAMTSKTKLLKNLIQQKPIQPQKDVVTI